MDGEPLQLRLQGLTSPLFPRESAGLRYTALCAYYQAKAQMNNHSNFT
ncbi:hypothetical protein BACI349Y_580046 [Bacillus sp. 349Y]|nr:hypothetical protein BACI349Y_580046 [Bacillus sp. 349Y]